MQRVSLQGARALNASPVGLSGANDRLGGGICTPESAERSAEE